MRPAGVADAHLDACIDVARETLGPDEFSSILRFALDAILADIKDDLAEFGVIPDEWFSEQGLMDSGAVRRALDRVAEHGKSYEQDGAIWFRATDYGDEKDRVVVRENGRTTYFASDIAYHLQKRERGFEKLLDILGADHHGYIARVQGGLEAMGRTPRIARSETRAIRPRCSGARKKCRCRRGRASSSRCGPLREEVGNDAARYFFVMRSNEQHLDFDLELAKSQTSDNPAYYIQYAHARVWSVMRELENQSLTWDANQAGAHFGVAHRRA